MWCCVGVGISDYPSSVRTWRLLMLLEGNTTNLVTQLNAILELFALLYMVWEKKKIKGKACPPVSCGGDMALVAGM